MRSRSGYRFPTVLHMRSDTSIVQVTSQSDRARLGALPGVTAVVVSSPKIPLFGIGVGYGPLWREDQPPQGNSLPPSVQAVVATDGYFRAMGIPLVTGRTFEPAVRQRQDAALIDRTLAMQFWHGLDGRGGLSDIGRCISRCSRLRIRSSVSSARCETRRFRRRRMASCICRTSWRRIRTTEPLRERSPSPSGRRVIRGRWCLKCRRSSMRSTERCRYLEFSQCAKSRASRWCVFRS